MTHREQLAILALLIILLLVFALFPRSAASDVPVSLPISPLPGYSFEPVTAGKEVFSERLLRAATATPGAIGRQACRLDADAGCSLSARPATPSPSVRAVPSVAPVRTPATPARESSVGSTASVTGTASWFRSPAGVSAAGPALRTALGPGWRGSRVRVTGPAGSAVTTLGDWMRADRLIDLDDDVFPAVCGPLSRGICRVEVTW